MKKILAFIIISAACIVAVACGEEPDDASITKTIETVTTTTATTITTTIQEETTTAPPETTTAPEVITIPETTERVYDFVLNNNTMKAHNPNCSSVKDIKEGNSSEYTGTISDLESMGYAPCGKSKPW